MTLSHETRRLLELLDQASNNSLVHRGDVGTILDLAGAAGINVPLDEVAFAAKACWKIAGLMKQVGPAGRGYEALVSEFQRNSGTLLSLLQRLMKQAGSADAAVIESRYFSETPESLAARIELCRDLSWIKNMSIDHTTNRRV